jgi:predicted acylesterase/phospholipase RssA
MSFYLHNLFTDIPKLYPIYDTIVLGSGAVKGFELMGSLQYLYDTKRIVQKPKFVGTSVGSILAYLLAIGYTPIEIVGELHVADWLEKTGKTYDMSNVLNGKGISTFIYVQEALEQLTLAKVGRFLTMKQLFERTGIELYVCTYNITECCIEYINHTSHPDLNCITALRMSSNIPLLFDRFKYDNAYYIDGAFGDSFPIMKGVEIGKNVIGLHIAVHKDVLKDDPSAGLVSYLGKLFAFPMMEKIKSDVSQAINTDRVDIIELISNDISTLLQFSVGKIDRLKMFRFGYKFCKTYFEK